MRLATVLVFSIAMSAYGQWERDNSNPVVDGMAASSRLANEVRQRQLAEQQAELVKAQTEQIRIQNQQLRAQGQQPAGPLGANLANSSEALDKAIESVSRRYPDLNAMGTEMIRIETLIESRRLPLENYIEGLYLMAKYASFSQVPRSPTPGLAQRLAGSEGLGDRRVPVPPPPGVP